MNLTGCTIRQKSMIGRIINLLKIYWIRIRNNAPGKDFNLIFKRLKLGIIGFSLQMSNEKLRLD